MTPKLLPFRNNCLKILCLTFKNFPNIWASFVVGFNFYSFVVSAVYKLTVFLEGGLVKEINKRLVSFAFLKKTLQIIESERTAETT